ncbi:MAG: cellulase family glycosylhydrolase [bacterium]
MANKKKLYKIIAVAVVIILIIYEPIVRIGHDSKKNIKWGVAFSKPYAVELGLDWRKLFNDMINDLGVKAVRLPIYWDDVEKEKDIYNFDDYDWMMEQAQKAGVEAVFVVGQRLPRWPECHRPQWLNSMEQEDQDSELLIWIDDVVKRYSKYENIVMWQVENEPFLKLFGECEKVNPKLLKKEIDLVKSLDSRPILITDSGELSLWLKSSKSGDYLGTTVYRIVHNPTIGYWSYFFIPASFYRFKSRLNFRSWDKMIVSELQAEPWYSNQENAATMNMEEQFKSMNLEKFEDNINYARKIGFSSVYLWGVEWWGWLKEEKGDDTMWEAAKEVFR